MMRTTWAELIVIIGLCIAGCGGGGKIAIGSHDGGAHDHTVNFDRHRPEHVIGPGEELGAGHVDSAGSPLFEAGALDIDLGPVVQPSGPDYPVLAAPPCTGTAPPPVGSARTSFQTNAAYDPLIAVAADRVIVHRHDAKDSNVTMSSWSAAGYAVEKMFFIGADGNNYIGGNVNHPDIERHKDGSPWMVDTRSYMVPSAAWTGWCDGLVKAGIDGGAQAINPEEPLLHHEGGYSQRFKEAWQEYYGSGWVEPTASPDNFWRASKLKAELYYRLVEHLTGTTKTHGQGAVEYIQPVHSPLSYAAGRMLFPHGRTATLPELHGFVGQVWTHPVRQLLDEKHSACSVNPVKHTDCEYFESALLLYSYFANLVRGSGKAMFFLADPVEDNPSYSWEEYEEWYKETVAAALMFPWISQYELLPWPERIYLPSDIGGPEVGPDRYLRQLQAIFNAQQEMGSNLQWQSASPVHGLGILVGDSLQWQDKDARGIEGFRALSFPLVRAGIALDVVPLERVVEPAFLASFRALLLTFDGQKPLAEAEVQALASWVKAGGVLLIIGVGDTYDGVQEWWQAKGWTSPTQALLAALGAGVDLASGQLELGPLLGSLELQRSVLTPLTSALGDKLTVPRVPITEWPEYLESGKVRAFTLTAARALYTLPSGKSVIFDEQLGQGAVVYVGLAPQDLGISAAGSTLLWELARYAGEGWGGIPVRALPYFWLRRGQYHLVNVMTAPPLLSGVFVDLFDENLSVRKNPQLEIGRVRLLKQVDALIGGGVPRLLHSNQAVSGLQETSSSLRLSIAGPQSATALLRISLEGKSITNVQPAVTVTVDPQSDTALISLPAKAQGQQVELSF